MYSKPTSVKFIRAAKVACVGTLSAATLTLLPHLLLLLLPIGCLASR
ncbi:hypothetical protein [Glaciimonas sp. PCH181]|nr:hypothetical protein [Glaciimonas sp. PCH181]